MIKRFENIPQGKRLYFASDFHLGAPSLEESRDRERKIVRWLERVSDDAAGIVLVGDIFDFWFEYKHAIPKGHSRFFGKMAQLADQGIPILIFVGNHDLWMEDYFQQEFGIEVFTDPQTFVVNNGKIYVAHGDGLGPGDHKYKFLKKVFTNPVSNWLFHWLHPNIGVGLMKYWSGKSRASKAGKEDEFLGDEEWLIQHSRKVHKDHPHDYYVFGHRHMAVEYELDKGVKYINLGEWIQACTYGEFDPSGFKLKKFEV